MRWRTSSSSLGLVFGMEIVLHETEAEREKLMCAVGEAITAFAFVEIGLSHVYAAAMRPASFAASAATLWAALHVETKLRIARTAGKHAQWPQGFEERYFNLINRTGNRASTRHKI